MDKNDSVIQARRQLGWGVVRLAHEAGASPSTVYSIEAGERSPQIATAHRIATALGYPLDDLFPTAR